jgi:chemotaxis protein methyltransferase CheR
MAAGGMRFDSDALGLSGTGGALLRDLIHDRLGLFYDETRGNQLLDKLAPLVVARGFDSFLDYYYLLRYDPSANGEWGQVMDALSVPETYFWREADQVRAVVTEIVPRLVDQGAQPLRIWSVPCSSGEEPLSIAMMLNEAGWFDRAPIRILASDASPAAIRRAREGLYRERSFRRLPPALREKYFERERDGWRVDPLLAARVQWSVVNLFEREQAAQLATAPVIFCRNLLIYFSERSLARVVSLFAEMMPTPGYLCLGVSESLLRHTTRFELQDIDGVYVYVKR